MTMTFENTTTARRARAPKQAPKTALPEHTPLAWAPDQAQTWIAHAHAPMPFDSALELVASAAHNDGERVDDVADLRAWAFGSMDRQTMQIMPRVGIGIASAPAPVTLRRHAFAQLCKRIDVPAQYVATLPPQLQTLCMNWGMAHASDQRPALLRKAGGELRAIVSDRYATVDDTTLLSILDDVLKRSGYRHDAMVRSTVVGPHTVLRVTIPTGAVELRRGDVMEWGIDIANSELGLRSVQISPVTYRLICTNGMRSAEKGAGARFPHIGDPIKMREDIAAIVPTALAEARGDLDRWRRSVDDMIDNAFNELDSLRGFGLTPSETQSVGRKLLELPETASSESLSEALRTARVDSYALTNAITETARDRSDVVARLRLEETAHRYLARRVG